VSSRQLAKLLGLHPQTLANWRSLDLKEGRGHAAPGRPLYKRFGSAVRYAIAPDGAPVLAPKHGQASQATHDEE
jgi:hypothetical protein